MSAIGSVIVMVSQAFSPRFPRAHALADLSAYRVGSKGWATAVRRSPTALGDARQLATVRHLAEADAAEPELAVDRVRSPASLAPGIAAHLELRLARRLVD